MFRIAQFATGRIRRGGHDSAVKRCMVARLCRSRPVHPCAMPHLNSWLLFWFVGNFENNLATRVTSRDLFLGFNCFRKRERARHNHFDFLLVN